MNHRIGRVVFVTLFSLAVAWFSYQWITDPSGRAERARQELVVEAARRELAAATGIVGAELVDPLSPQRKVGKVYVFRSGPNWEVSGYYRRNQQDRWHPWLMTLDMDLQRRWLKVQDDALVERAADDPSIEISP